MTGTPLAGASGSLNVTSLARGSVLAPSAAVQIASGADTLVITKAQLVLSRLELASTANAGCDDDDSQPGCAEIERSTVLVDLPVDAGVQTLINASIPAGSYSSLEAKLRVPKSGDDAKAAALLAAHPEFAGGNVRVEGTFRGTPFVYTGTVQGRLETQFSAPLVVATDATSLNVTVHVDLSTWFMNGASLIDPSSGNAGGANESLISANISRSFRAFRDDGRRGEDDGNGGHGGGSDDGPGHG